MKRLIDILILFVCSAVFLCFSDSVVKPVIALLSAIICISVQLCVKNRYTLFISEIFFAAICFVNPFVCYFIPAALYSAVGSRRFMSCAFFAAAYGANIYFEGADNKILLVVFALMALSVLLCVRTSALCQKETDIVRMRDSDVELTNALKDKNKDLMEKQDYEVYLATLTERNRIAREIHDNVGHLLSRSLLQTGALIALTDKEKQPEQYEQLASVKNTLNSAMNSIRESVHDLRDDSVDLKMAISDAVNEMRKNYIVTLETDVSDSVPSPIRLCFISVVKEAMSNIVKHSNATEITVILREHPALYQLCISDNGSEVRGVSSDGMGLANMRERVEALGGIIKITSYDGFKIFISIRKDEAQ